LSDRVDTLAHAVSAAAATLAKKDGELVATRRALEVRLGDLETYVTDALQELRAVASAIAAPPRAEKRSIDGKVVLLTEEVAMLATKLEALATRSDTTARRVETHDRELGSLRDGSLTSKLEQRLDEALAQLTDFGASLDAHQERIAGLETARTAPTDGVQERLAELEETVRELTTGRQALEQLQVGTPEDVEARFAELGTSVIGLRDRIEAVDARLNAHPSALDRDFAEGGRFDAIVGDLRSLAQILSSTTTGDHRELAVRLDALHDALGAALERIDALETEVPEANEGAPTLRVEQLEHELATIRARIRHTSSSAEIAAQLDALRVEVSKVVTRLDRTEDLASRTAYNTSASTSRMSSTVDELGRRIDQLEHLEHEVLAKLERAQALWPVALRVLEGRIDDLAARGRADAAGDDDLLAALNEGLETAHSVLADAGAPPRRSSTDPEAVPEKPPPKRSRSRRAGSKSNRST
jgi:chromosome segregation ATPase